jgi:hypothetical protein
MDSVTVDPNAPHNTSIGTIVVANHVHRVMREPLPLGEIPRRPMHPGNRLSVSDNLHDRFSPFHQSFAVQNPV